MTPQKKTSRGASKTSDPLLKTVGKSSAIRQKSPTSRSKPTSRTASKSTGSSTTRSTSRARSTRLGRAGDQPAADSRQRLGSLLQTKPRHSRKPVREGLSLDRKLDIAGIVMSLAGVLTLLSMLSPIQGSLTGRWGSVLGLAFGWGKYLFPLILVGVGLWFILRNFERVPQLAVERLIGLILLYWNLLSIVHFGSMLYNGQDALSLAQLAQAGGYAGGTVVGLLTTGLGVGGAVIALAAWFLIALALSLDITIAEMLRGVSSLVERLQDWFSETMQERRSTSSRSVPASAGYIGMHPVPPAAFPASGSAAELGGPPAAIFVPEQIQQGPAAKAVEWKLPTIEPILDKGVEADYSAEIDQHRALVIEETLSSFGAPGKVVEINRGPTITQFGVEPDFIESRGGRMRVRVGKIASLVDDLALALSARTIRVQAPVPGKGFVGIEVPNEEVSLVALRDLIESEAFKRLKSPLRFALGLNVSGNAVAADLSNMPHLLIAGATGSGKSVCVNALICCLLMNNTPEDLRMVMVDPKRVELTGYNGVPHLLAPVVVDIERVVTVLQWVTREMDMRYHKLAEAGCRNIQEYNQKVAARGEKKLPFLVVIVDELADLMMLSPDETERTITRLAQLARATGIHLVIATQRPSVDVVTGLIKANFPARIAFAVASGVDSRVILDQPGAERLLGRGDMLFQAPDAPAPVRLQGVFVSESEIVRLVSYWQEFAGLVKVSGTVAGGIVDAAPGGIPLKQMPLWEELEEEKGDPMLKEAIDLSRRQGRASISMLQRRMRIGYTRAARLIETMEERGIVGSPDPGTGTREILDYGPAAPPIDEA